MTINAVVYDIECFPNATSMVAIDLNSDAEWYFEISQWRNDGVALHGFLNWLSRNGWYLIGFNNIGYDYNLLHAFFTEPVGFGPDKFYAINQSIIGSYDRFGKTVRPDERYIKQIDLYKIHHFDNQSKRQSLKGLEVNMRSRRVSESKVPFGQPIRQDQLASNYAYNRDDVTETKKFAHISMKMLEFRLHMAKRISGDIINFSESKIGKELVAQRIGEDLCYTRISGKREPRQTIRDGIRLSECIFPFIRFDEPEFQRIHQWLLTQTVDETRGGFQEINPVVKGFEFKIGFGGLHGSVKHQRFKSDDEWVIVDDDVGGYYPSVIIEYGLAPEHLGDKFRQEFRAIKEERKLHPKGTPENGALKLAGNSVFGDSNNPYSIYRDAKFMLTTTINGQMMLCMLAEKLMAIPTLSLIQANTDGLTYFVHRSMIPEVKRVRDEWQQLTRMELEQAIYSRMFIRDVNNYIAENESGKLKLKGAYWSPRDESWNEDIILDPRNPGPPAFHKNFSFVVTQRAAVDHMLNGTDIETFVYTTTNPFDFMGCEKVDKKSTLMIGNEAQGRVTRYYVAKTGEPMRKIMKSKYPDRLGQFKQGAGVSDEAYDRWQAAWGNVHNPEVHTKNRSTYPADNVTNVNVGMLVRECNNVESFDFLNLNYEYYVNEARKLVI